MRFRQRVLTRGDYEEGVAAKRLEMVDRDRLEIVPEIQPLQGKLETRMEYIPNTPYLIDEFETIGIQMGDGKWIVRKRGDETIPLNAGLSVRVDNFPQVGKIMYGFINLVGNPLMISQSIEYTDQFIMNSEILLESNFVEAWDGTEWVYGHVWKREDDKFLFEKSTGEMIYISMETNFRLVNDQTVYLPGYGPTNIKREDFYFGNVMFGDLDNLADKMVRGEFRRDVLDDVDIDIDFQNRFVDHIYNLVFQYINKDIARGGIHYTKAKAIATVVRSFIDEYYVEMMDLEQPGSSKEIFTDIGALLIPRMGNIPLRDLVDEMVQRVKEEGIDNLYQFLGEFTGRMEVYLKNLVFNQMVVGVNGITMFLIGLMEMVNMNQALKQIELTESPIMPLARPSLKLMSMETGNAKTNLENKLCMVLEPIHDFSYERTKIRGVADIIQRLTSKYISSHKTPQTISTSGEFERRNYIEYSAEFDEPRYVQAFSYQGRLTNETKKGEFYKAVRWVVEQFIMNRPLVRDAKGTVFLEKLFNIKKESKSVEIAIDGASGGMEIGSSGILLVDYPRDIFKIPMLGSKDKSPKLYTGDDAVRIMNHVGKLTFGIEDSSGGKRRLNWRSGDKYTAKEKIFVENFITGKREKYSVISVANLSKSMASVEKLKTLAPWEKDLAYWSLLNLKRAGDQGQALYAQKIDGVFETLDFLAAAFASSRGVDYLVNSDSLNVLYMKIKQDIKYPDFKRQLSALIFRTAVKEGYEDLPKIMEGIINFAEKLPAETGKGVDETRMDFLSIAKELLGVGVVLRSNFVQANKGKIAERMNSFFKEFTNRLAFVDFQESRSRGNSLRNIIDSYLQFLYQKKLITKFFDSNFQFISRLNGALTLLKKKIGRLSERGYLRSNKELKLLIREKCVLPVLGFINEIIPGVSTLDFVLSNGKKISISPNLGDRTETYRRIFKEVKERLPNFIEDIDSSKTNEVIVPQSEEFFDLVSNYIELVEFIGRYP